MLPPQHSMTLVRAAHLSRAFAVSAARPHCVRQNPTHLDLPFAGACTFQLWKPQSTGRGMPFASITSAFQQHQQQRRDQRPMPVGLFSVAK